MTEDLKSAQNFDYGLHNLINIHHSDLVSFFLGKTPLFN
jgi:hypothetical protein